MDQIQIKMMPLGHTQPEQPQGWRYDFAVTSDNQTFTRVVIVSDDCPEPQREDAAKAIFQHWSDTLAQEIAKL